MLSSLPVLIANVNALRKTERKRPLTKRQEAMIKEQVAMRKKHGEFTLFPEKFEEA